MGEGGAEDVVEGEGKERGSHDKCSLEYMNCWYYRECDVCAEMDLMCSWCLLPMVLTQGKPISGLSSGIIPFL